MKLPKETAAIVPYLDHPNGHIRDTAQRVLVERNDPTVVDAVKKLTIEGKLPHSHAAMTMQGMTMMAK